MALPSDGCNVTILTEEPFTGSMTVDVDSSTYSEFFV